jgi:hypothetical protein
MTEITKVTNKQATPQHLRMYFIDATPTYPLGSVPPSPPNGGSPGSTMILTTYSGLVSLKFSVGDTKTDFPIQYPVLGLFRTAQGSTTGIFPIRRSEFVAATAMVALTNLVDKTDPAIFQVTAATADLQTVTLSPNRPVLAVVLTTSIGAQNAEHWGFQYHVTVLTKVIADIPKGEPPILPPILLGAQTLGQTWDGSYGPISPEGVAGQPQT